jgi:hypothetical protein
MTARTFERNGGLNIISLLEQGSNISIQANMSLRCVNACALFQGSIRQWSQPAAFHFGSGGTPRRRRAGACRLQRPISERGAEGAR